MKAAIITPENALAFEEIPQPTLPEGGALIRVTGCGICGSDLDKLLNRNPVPGSVLGHEVVGVIVALSETAKTALQIGQRVSVAHHVPCQDCYYCRHQSPSMCRTFKETNIYPGGFSEIIAVSADHLAHTVFPLPDFLSDLAASCIEPLACCLRAVDRLPQDIGRNVLVVGLGFIGLMTAQYLKHLGFHTFGIDLKADRIHLAQQHHMLDIATTNQHALQEQIQAQTEGRGVDIVFLSIVNPETLKLAFEAIRDGGTIGLFTSYGKGAPILNQNELYFREINIVASYSPSLAHLQKAYAYIKDGVIQVEPLMTHTFPLYKAQDAMDCYRSGEAIKVFIQQ